ncbi:DNA-binding protein HU 1 [Streptomyces laurentii]|uniref:DNA-binding protein HU 1 n=2 Tax=Streptomyces TaxID=1883 RepID=A0A160P040_STRLU|nr:DNA-binding protein HU 1 [Streptomyces laurentii]
MVWDRTRVQGVSEGPGSIGFAVPTHAAPAAWTASQATRLTGKKKHGSNEMNRSELVAALADRAEVTRKDADAVLAALAETVGEVVAKGDEKVTIPGFLTFERTHRAARTARNPQTGDPINIPAGFSVKVSAGSKLKEAAKGK